MLLDPAQIDLLTENLVEAVKTDNVKKFLDVAPRLSTPRIASVLRDAPGSFLQSVLNQMPPDKAGRIMGHLPHELISLMFESGDGRLAKLLSGTPPDEAADIIQHLPQGLSAEVLSSFDSVKKKELEHLLHYEPGTAGSVMTSQFVTIESNCSVKQTIDALLGTGASVRRPAYVYSQNIEGKLQGVISLKDLVRYEPDKKIEDIMNQNVVTVRADDSAEDAARLLRDRRFAALPVVDDRDRLVGVITFEDAMDIMSESIAESFTLVGGSSDESFFTPPFAAVKKRLPWMAINVFLNLGAVTVITGFEATIEQVAILAAFLPMITDMGGNVGIQALSVSIRSQALGESKMRDFTLAMRKELYIGALNGLVLGALFAAIAFAWRGNIWLGVLAGIALGMNVLLAGIVGGCLPYIIKFFGKDPAMMTGPFLTTITDISGVSIYLGLSTIFIIRLMA